MGKKSRLPSLAKVMKDDVKGIKNQYFRIAKVVGNTAKNHFTRSFRNQGFRDKGVRKWKPRKGEKRVSGTKAGVFTTGRKKGQRVKRSDQESRGILIGKGGGRKLSRSIRVLKRSRSSVTVGSTVKYAGVHNYGLKSGRGKGFKMPKRKFIGDSRILNDNIISIIKKFTEKGFKK